MDLNNLITRLLSLFIVNDCEIIQFQGRKSTKEFSNEAFDFVLGYGLRGIEEHKWRKLMTQQKFPVQRRLFSWQIHGRE